MMTRKRSLLVLPLLLLHTCHAATAAAAAAASMITVTSSSSARSPPPELPIFLLLKRTRGGAAGRGIGGGGGGGSSSGFPSLPFFPTTTQPPKSSSSSSHSSSSSTAAAPTSWGSEHFDARPLVLEPRVVENIKSRDSRVGLIRKVYGILGVQLFITAAVTYLFFQSPQVVHFLLTKGSWIVLLSMVTSIGSAIALGMRYSRVFPTNLGLLGLFTAGESVIIGLITSRYKADAVLLAALQTAAAVTGLSLFAFRKNQKYDLTAFGSALFSGLLIMLMSGVFAYFLKVKIPEVVMGGFGALLFSVFLIYDTQRIVGGGATQLDDRDYVLGAMDLYLDITRIFIYLLRILASENGRE